MGVSNAVFLAIRETSEVEDAGWWVRVMHHADFNVPVAFINDFVSLKFTTELNDVGAGSITLSRDSSFWDAQLWNGTSTTDLEGDHDYLFQCWENGVHRFDFIGTRKQNDDVNDDEERMLTISGPGLAGTLRWAAIIPPNFPNYRPSVHWPNTIPAMQLFYKLLKANQSLDVVSYIVMSFSQSKDSAGKEWADYKNPRTIEIEYGQDLLTTLNMATGQDDDEPWNIRADWHMWPGGILDVRQSFGAHLENKVRFYEGDILDKSRDRNSEDIRNYVLVRDASGNISLVENTASKNQWQRRIHVDISHANITDVARRDKVASLILEGKKDESSEWTIKIPYDRPTRRPFVDFNVGDWVGVMRYTENSPSTMMSFRVAAITVYVDVDDTEVELTLQSLADAKRRRINQTLTRLINNNPLSAIKLPEGYDVPPDIAFPIIWNPKTGFKAVNPNE